MGGNVIREPELNGFVYHPLHHIRRMACQVWNPRRASDDRRSYPPSRVAVATVPGAAIRTAVILSRTPITDGLPKRYKTTRIESFALYLICSAEDLGLQQYCGHERACPKTPDATLPCASVFPSRTMRNGSGNLRKNETRRRSSDGPIRHCG